MIKAIIFDFDGVIVDTEPDRFNFLQKHLGNQGIILRSEFFSLFSGRKTAAALKEAIPGISQNIIFGADVARQKYLKEKISSLKSIPKLKPFLNLLSKKYTLSITTGSNYEIVDKFLEKQDLAKYFTVKITGEQFTSSKPNPECYIMTLKKLKIKSSEAIIIEDSEAGVIAGKSAGCKVFGLKNKYNEKQLRKADKVFENYVELRTYFKKDNEFI